MKFLNAIKLNPTISIPKQKVCPFISMENVDFHSREPLAYEMKAFSSGVKFEDGDTVIARITPCLQNGKILIKLLKELCWLVTIVGMRFPTIFLRPGKW